MPGGAPITANPNACTNAIASAAGLNLQVNLQGGYFWVVVSNPSENFAPQYYFNVNAEPIVKITSSTTASDPTYKRPAAFTQGWVTHQFVRTRPLHQRSHGGLQQLRLPGGAGHRRPERGLLLRSNLRLLPARPG
jgi:hypothetical protein